MTNLKCPKEILYHRPDQVAESMFDCHSKLYSTLWSFVPDMEERMKKDDISVWSFSPFADVDSKYSMSHYWEKLSDEMKADIIKVCATYI